jgi:hypothetical protein
LSPLIREFISENPNKNYALYLSKCDLANSIAELCEDREIEFSESLPHYDRNYIFTSFDLSGFKSFLNTIGELHQGYGWVINKTFCAGIGETIEVIGYAEGISINQPIYLSGHRNYIKKIADRSNSPHAYASNSLFLSLKEIPKDFLICPLLERVTDTDAAGSAMSLQKRICDKNIALFANN